jgi:hypothetical protein
VINRQVVVVMVAVMVLVLVLVQMDRSVAQDPSLLHSFLF